MICSQACVTAQNKTEISNRALKAYRDAEQKIAKGDLLAAQSYLLKAAAEQPDWVEPFIKLGEIQFQRMEWQSSQENFEHALEIDGTSYPVLSYKLGEIAWQTEDMPAVVDHMDRFLKSTGRISPSLLAKAEKYKRDAIFISANSQKYDIEINALPPTINTRDLEYLPSLPAREDMMVFTRRLNGQEDFYVSIFQEGAWQLATPLADLNTHLNEGAHCLSADGTMLIFTACDMRTGLGSCDLYYSLRKGSTWSKPANLGPQVNTRYWDGQPSLSANGRSLYFSSERPGGIGGRDIWVIDRKGGGWGDAKNLSALNTPWNEEAPFVHASDESLYFMSDGHPGYGGADLFMARQKHGDWQPPMNLGSPINTKNDEGALHVQLDGSKAYFARSIATDGNPPVQIDIYEFEMPEAIRPRPATYINVLVLDSKTHQPLKAIVQLVDLDSKITYIKMLTNAEGRVLVCLASGQDYGLHISKDNYAFYSEHFSLLDTNTLLEPKEMIVYLHPIVIDTAIPNEPIVLNNIFFESGSAQLLESSFFELDELAEFLLKQPTLHILISGHTDDVGGIDENLLLSQQRAKSIYDYLVDKGVEEERLTFEGRGESEPIASNQTSEGRQKNRRTAFTILNK